MDAEGSGKGGEEDLNGVADVEDVVEAGTGEDLPEEREVGVGGGDGRQH